MGTQRLIPELRITGEKLIRLVFVNVTTMESVQPKLNSLTATGNIELISVRPKSFCIFDLRMALNDGQVLANSIAAALQGELTTLHGEGEKA
jgi:hypothetical protein